VHLTRVYGIRLYNLKIFLQRLLNSVILQFVFIWTIVYGLPPYTIVYMDLIYYKSKSFIVVLPSTIFIDCIFFVSYLFVSIKQALTARYSLSLLAYLSYLCGYTTSYIYGMHRVFKTVK